MDDGQWPSDPKSSDVDSQGYGGGWWHPEEESDDDFFSDLKAERMPGGRTST